MHRLFRGILIGSLVASSIVLGTSPASASACTSSGSFAGGAGTTLDPYRISTPGQLQYLANHITANSGMLNKTIVLTANIDLASCEFNGHGAGVPFRGTFDGQNFTISNLVVSRPSFSYGGLFPTTDDGATIKNVRFQSPRISALSYNGVVIGEGAATNLENIKIDDAIVTGAGSSSGAVAGQLTGQTGKTMDKLLVTNSTVYGVSNPGGLFGLVVDAAITKSAYLEGRVVMSGLDPNPGQIGGLISWAAGTSSMSESAFTGSVEVSQSQTVYAGLLVGRVNNGSLAVTDSYARGAVKTGSFTDAAGVASYLTSATVSLNRVYVQGSFYRLSDPTTFVNARAFAPTVSSASDSFYDSAIHTLWTSTTGGTAKTSSQLQSAATFTGANWTVTEDTTAIRAVSAPSEKWFLNPQIGEGYPVHSWAYRAAVYAIPCQLGTYSVDGFLPCVDASPGKYVAQTGSTAETNCAPGTYQANYRSISCLPAEPGYFVAAAGQAAQTQCAPGTTSSGSAISCFAIPPYSGPLLTGTAVIAVSGQAVTLSGQSLGSVTAASVEGQPLQVITKSEISITLQLPETLTPGNKDLVLTSGSGVVTIQGALRLVSPSGLSLIANDVVIKRIGDQVRLVVSSPVGLGKIQFKVNGKEFAWVRAADSSDPKLRTNPNGTYFVRNRALADGQNSIEIYVNGERVKRVLYTR